MMTKRRRPFIFIYTFILTLMILIITLYTYFYAKNQNKWMLELLTTSLFKIPLLVYLLIFTAAVSGIVFGVLYLVDRQTYGRIEERLHLLSIGNYTHAVFEPMSKKQIIDDTDGTINQDIYTIRKNMRTMSKELQEMSAMPRLVDGESKEDIIKEERHRIARELHDSVSQQLFAATMMLSALNESVEDLDVPEVVNTQLNLIESIINASQSEMRALLLHLRPINLEEKTLQQGVELLLNELQTKINIEIAWDVDDLTLPSSVEDHLFRITQELLSNTLRHAKADLLEVYLKKIDDIVLLRVVDDGVGFDMSEGNVGSYGLQNINERVQSMGGTYKLISFKGQGTSIEIKVPIIKENEDDSSIISR